MKIAPSASTSRDGGVAQLGERLLCKQEAVGSIPSTSIFASSLQFLLSYASPRVLQHTSAAQAAQKSQILCKKPLKKQKQNL